MFFQELQKFSKSNWWVYGVFFLVLAVVNITGKGSLAEIVILFGANFLGNLFVMVSMGNYSIHNNKIASIYHIAATTAFTFIGVYGFLDQGVGQYLVFQISFILGALKAGLFYNYEKNLSFLNEYTLLGINIILYIFFYNYFSPDIPSSIQGLGFVCATIGLISTRDIVRYSLSVVGSVFILLGSLMIVMSSYMAGNLDGIALGFTLLTGATFVYYMKLLPGYIRLLQQPK